MIRAVALFVVLATASACGYALAGRGNALPADIHVIGVPMMVNHSTQPGIDVVLTEAVRQEFSSRGKYRTIPDEKGADAVLTATITSVQRTVVNMTDRQATRYRILVSVSIEFRDKIRDKVLRQDPRLQFTEEYDAATSTTANDASNFFGGDQTALQKIAKSFAQMVVTSIFEAF